MTRTARIAPTLAALVAACASGAATAPPVRESAAASAAPARPAPHPALRAHARQAARLRALVEEEREPADRARALHRLADLAAETRARVVRARLELRARRDAVN